MKKKELFLLTVAALLIVFAFGSRMFQGQRAERVATLAATSTVLEPAHAMTLGADDAPVTIVEFFDPACETCAVFYGPVKEMMAENPGKIRLVLRYAPFHPGSDHAVKILEAARKQGKYWETLDMLFGTQAYWANHHEPRPDAIWRFLPRLGLDLDRLRADMADPALDVLIRQDLADAETLGVRKTPGFLVNGKPLVQFGLPQLQDLVRAELAATR